MNVEFFLSVYNQIDPSVGSVMTKLLFDTLDESLQIRFEGWVSTRFFFFPPQINERAWFFCQELRFKFMRWTDQM